jgi:hypothetical protein
MRGTRIEKEVEMCSTNLANKTKCMNTNAKKWGEKKISKEVSNSQRISVRHDRFFMGFYKVSVSSVQVLVHRWR